MQHAPQPSVLRLLPAASIALTFAASLVIASSGSAAEDRTRLLVGFVPGLSSQARGQTLAAAGADEVGSIPDIGVRVVSVSAATSTRALDVLRATPGVAFAEPDGRLQPQDGLPSDPSFPQTFAVGGGAWGWYTTHTTQAWDVTAGSLSVVIAILDTGMNTAVTNGGLADFNGQLVSGWNVLTGSSDTTTTQSHGTYVAGVAGLALANGTGNAGVCPRCRIMPVVVGTDSGASWSNVATGIAWAADHGARIINLSWAGSSDSATMQSAINYAHSKGLVVFAAAGNGNCNCVTYPAADQNVLGVAGVDNSGNKQGDSNYGSWVKVAAPEGDMTAWPTINGGSSSGPGYAPVGGTSVASPFAAGIAGLLLSANPSFTNTQVEQAIEQSSLPVGFSLAYGRVDALAALNYLGFSDRQASSAPTNTSPPLIYLETNGDFNYTPLGSSAPQPGQVLLRGQGAWTGSAPLSLSGVTWLRCNASGTNCTTAGTGAKYTVQSTDDGSTFELRITVKNAIGQATFTTPPSQPVGGTAPSQPPANTTAPVVSGTLLAGQQLQMTTGTWSNSPTSFAYQWQRCNATGANCAAIAGATASTYTVASADVGSTLRGAVTASNAAGSATATSAVTAVVPNVQTFTFTGALTKSVSSLSFPVTIGAGEADATLTFSTSKSTTMTVALLDASGATVGQASGSSSPLTLKLPGLAAGAYAYVVAGSGYKGSVSFTLSVTAPGQ